MTLPSDIILTRYDSPCGPLILGCRGDALCLCDWAKAWSTMSEATWDRQPVIDEAARQLDEYFAHKRQSFSVPLLPLGTPFQQRVWQSLLQIPYGTTISYARQAELLGMPRALRAIAAANGRNRLSIFIPCHRVIGANGALTGYRGGLAAKRFLIELEKHL